MASSKHDFLPSREAELLNWSRTFSEHINNAAPSYGLTPAQAADYSALNDAYATAYQLSQDPGTRTPVQITAKNLAKAALKSEARSLARIVRAAPGVTDAQRVELGLTVADENPSAVQPPQHAPRLSVVTTIGRTIRIRLRDAGVTKRKGKPPGVAGAAVFSYVLPPDSTAGDGPPLVLSEWKFQGTTSRVDFDVRISAADGGVPGSRVWLCAYWFNPRQQRGPVSQPIMTWTQFGVELESKPSGHSLALAA